MGVDHTADRGTFPSFFGVIIMMMHFVQIWEVKVLYFIGVFPQLSFCLYFVHGPHF